MDALFADLLMSRVVSVSLLSAESPGEDLRGILRRLVAGVAKDLEKLEDRPEDRVHDIRVRMKKFRAVLRLAEGVLKRPAYAKTDKQARRLKDHFGSARDSDVQRELLLDLLDKKEAATTAAAVGLAEAEPPQCHAADVSPQLLCETLGSLLEDLDLESLGRDELIASWLATYSGSRRAMSACRRDNDDDFLFHEWRKRVKEILYQSTVLGPPLDKFVPKADRLSSVLGTHHDLAILSHRLAGRPGVAKAQKAVRRKKKQVAQRTLAMGGKLFQKKDPAILGKLGLP